MLTCYFCKKSLFSGELHACVAADVLHQNIYKEKPEYSTQLEYLALAVRNYIAWYERIPMPNDCEEDIDDTINEIDAEYAAFNEMRDALLKLQGNKK